ncbi:hypothetical protein KIH41_15830 [Litoribacter ruber]|uniref:DUF4221 domain-containing protein n=1 Tax=Litoribacter ruber TaxID=702568 RepID=A0AAP2G5N4_9BACT|nr:MULTISPECIES: hypothetical protein [Litoribacter]MBS9524738.1 hypothetical protein [Litoribacter alkaliphilus]MBT0812759.1 hypothetical protein [Litoribacter ruber]
MRSLLVCALFLILFSCSDNSPSIKPANLFDFESGQFIINKPSDSNILMFTGTVESDSGRYFVSETTNKYELFDFETGLRKFSFQIPFDGPEAMKRSMNGTAMISPAEYVAFNQIGQFHSYVNGRLNRDIHINLSEITQHKFTQISKGTGNLTKLSTGKYQVVLNPFDIMDPNGGFDTEFSAWVFQIDLEKGISCVSNFNSPYDESFHDSPSATLTLGTRNHAQDEYWFMYALSDSVYRIEDCKIVQNHKLDSGNEVIYYPDVVTRNGRNTQWNSNPKNHKNIKLFYDNKTSTFLRVLELPKKINEEDLKAMDVRKASKLKSDYQILIYDQQWNLGAILNFTIPEGNNLESCFVHEGIFYLNQPNQENEDEYVLMKFDLTKAII